MISHRHKCIFIHVPKCAGSSIEKALGHFDLFEGRGAQDHRSIQDIKPSTGLSLVSRRNFRHLRHRYFKTHLNPANNYWVNRPQYEHYFKFTIIRNPWSRAYSYYRGVVRDELNYTHRRMTPEMSFSDFARKFCGKGNLKSQLAWLRDANGKLDLDFVGRFEHLQRDFGTITENIGAKDVELPHLLNSQDDSWRKAYDSDLIEFVRNAYREEIEAFGYSFD